MSRTEPREEALKCLYEAEQRRSDPLTATLGRRAAELANGVWTEREALDEAIGKAAQRWRVERMPVVDRNVLRIWPARSNANSPK